LLTINDKGKARGKRGKRGECQEKGLMAEGGKGGWNSFKRSLCIVYGKGK